jgi:hypothetical protein
MFNLSAGLFYSDYNKHFIAKADRHEQLAYRRKLKHRARKQFNKKKKVYN